MADRPMLPTDSLEGMGMYDREDLRRAAERITKFGRDLSSGRWIDEGYANLPDLKAYFEASARLTKEQHGLRSAGKRPRWNPSERAYASVVEGILVEELGREDSLS